MTTIGEASSLARRIIAATVALLLGLVALTGCTNLLPAAEESAERMGNDARDIGLTDVRASASMQESPIPYIVFWAKGDATVDREALAEFMARVSESRTPVGSFTIELSDASSATRAMTLWPREAISSTALMSIITYAEQVPSTELTITGTGDSRARFDLSIELGDNSRRGTDLADIDAAIDWGRSALTLASASGGPDPLVDVDRDGSTLRASGVHVGLTAGDAELAAAGLVRDAIAAVAGATGEIYFVGPTASADGRGKVTVYLDDGTSADTADRLATALLELDLGADDYDRRVFLGNALIGESASPTQT